MTGRLDGKVAIVTGGASGMGRATVLRFLDEGARVVIGDINAENGAAAIAEIDRRGQADAALFQGTDVCEEADIAALVAAALDRFGRIDCLYNNAGVGGAFGPIAETEVAEWDFTFHVLVRSVFLGMKHAAPVLRRQGQGGSIISTASIAGLGGGGGSHAYSAAKAAVVNLTRSVATELAVDRIRVNAIAPGVIRTPLFHGNKPDEMEAIARDKQIWPDLGEGEDIAGAALYLASDDSRYVTGTTLVVDGGLTAQGPNIWGKGKQNPMLRRAGVNRGSTGQAHDVRRPGGSD